jgi:hypothetical protein
MGQKKPSNNLLVRIDIRQVNEMDQLLPFIGDVGFPIVVTLYLLHRIEAKLDALNDTMINLPNRLRDELQNKVA